MENEQESNSKEIAMALPQNKRCCRPAVFPSCFGQCRLALKVIILARTKIPKARTHQFAIERLPRPPPPLRLRYGMPDEHTRTPSHHRVCFELCVSVAVF